MESQDLVVKIISELKLDFNESLKDLKKDNFNGHAKISNRLDILNGNVACIKKRQFRLRYILVGIGGTLIVLGLMPERLWELLGNII